MCRTDTENRLVTAGLFYALAPVGSAVEWAVQLNSIQWAALPSYTDQMLVILVLAFLYLFSYVNASHFIIRGRHTSPHLNKRAHVSGLDNGQNLKYYTNITLGGIPFSVGIDTGRQVAHPHPLLQLNLPSH